MLRSANHLPLIRNIFRILLGAILVFAGMRHLTVSRQEFLAQVPHWLPIDGNFVVLASGVVEILIGIGLIFLTRYRRTMGWITAVFFILIFPGNISQYTTGTDAFGLDTDQARLIRLFFQPLLVLWALWAAGIWPPFNKKQIVDQKTQKLK